jgi:predicted nucleotidyltransferase
MGIEEILGAKREEILRIAAKHGVTSIRVFGSVARGDAEAESDIDFLVEVGPKRTPWFPAGLICDLEDLLDRRVDVATPRGLHWYIKDRVLAEAVAL